VDRRRRGFTLLEVMVSLVISAMLVGMILSVFSRMTLAYRGQQGVAELQQILAAGQNMFERDLRMAGNQMPDGFWISADSSLHYPVEISNDADGFGPDELRIFYADTGAQARINTVNGRLISAQVLTEPVVSVEVDDAGDFVAGDVVVLSRSLKRQAADDVRYYACVVQIETITGNVLALDGAGNWGTPANEHCNFVRQGSESTESHMVYRFRARGYRIDHNRRDLAVLQFSPSAGMFDDWQDLAVGFTDLQVASRWDDTGVPAEAGDTNDLDTDPMREWYSDITQTAKTNPVVAEAPADEYRPTGYDLVPRSQLVGLRVSLVVRTHSRIDVVPSQRTPALIDPARPGNNDLGDRASVQLEGVPDTSRPLELRGEHVYRYATIGVDLRNMGVGR
jgi:prepilin-type N-terminal cleavage/methylation domain-containing protein